jgi:hypothetical protein
MNEMVEDLTIEYEENGMVVIKEVDKVILSKGAWATVLFRYQQWDPKKEDYGPDRYTIRRYRKLRGEYVQQSKFNISSQDQARKIVDALNGWMED